MKILVCGSREWQSFKVIEETLREYLPDLVVIHGDARGADKISGWVCKNKLKVPVRAYPADWNGLGKKAGPLRNIDMFNKERPDLVLVFHDDLSASKGTKHMVEYAQSHGCPVRVVTTRPELAQELVDAVKRLEEKVNGSVDHGGSVAGGPCEADAASLSQAGKAKEADPPAATRTSEGT